MKQVSFAPEIASFCQPLNTKIITIDEEREYNSFEEKTPQRRTYRRTSNDIPDYNSSDERTSQGRVFRRRDVLAWGIILLQALAILSFLGDRSKHNEAVTAEEKLRNLSFNGKPYHYHRRRYLEATSKDTNSSQTYYDPPTIYPDHNKRGSNLIGRVWHSNGSPYVNQDLQTGSCWCSTDNYCLCTPALAVDVILTSGDDVWLINREDTGVLALPGGFNEVGETVEEASRRELMEEVGIDFANQPLNLIGVYSDPKRDPRKHPVSVVFHMEIPADITLTAGDDAKEVVRLPLSEVSNVNFMHVDHKTILMDFIQTRRNYIENSNVDLSFRRSLCTIN